MKKTITGLLLVAFILLTGLLFYSQVDNSVSFDDIDYINKIIGADIRQIKLSGYDGQIRFIDHVQKKVLQTAPENSAIPRKSSREPKDLYLSGHGLCFDRSRVIEKILSAAGFRTRHIIIFKNPEKTNILFKLLDPRKHATHAVSEVLTCKGWIVVDSNKRFIALRSDNSPVSIKGLKDRAAKKKPFLWKDIYKSNLNKLYTEDFLFIYGLYSRHGYFYPPYNFIPDINWSEFLQNITG